MGNDPVNFTDPSSLVWDEDVATFFAGIGDAVTFGLTKKMRDGLGVGDLVARKRLPIPSALEEHIERLLEQIEPAEETLRRYAVGGVLCEFYCSVFLQEDATTSVNLRLPCALLQRVSKLGSSIEVFVYPAT